MDANESKEVQDDRENVRKPDTIFGIRYLQAFLLFSGLSIGFAVRAALSVGIVAMTDPTASSANVTIFPEWSKQTQDTILSSFFWGYVVFQIPAGLLCEKIGAKIILAIGLFINGVMTILLPLFATLGGWQALCVCRFLQGLCQSSLFPCIHGVQTKWVPTSERSRFSFYIFSGCMFGTAIELIVAGYIGGSSMGWPTIFYSLGAVNILWCIVWLYMQSDSPREHKWITKEEIMYIEASYEKKKKKLVAPWKKIFSSVVFWSLFITHGSNNWGYWTLMTETPSYMKGVNKVDIKSNGLLSSLPYIAHLILGYAFSLLSDYGINNKIVSRTAARKIANSIAYFGPTIFLVALSYSPPGNTFAAVAFLTASVGLNGAHIVGYLANHLDLSPNYAPSLMGVTNTFANIVAIFAPLAVGVIVKDDTDASQWRIIFIAASVIYFVGNLCFVFLGSAEIQPWNESDEKENKDDIENTDIKLENNVYGEIYRQGGDEKTCE